MGVLWGGGWHTSMINSPFEVGLSRAIMIVQMEFLNPILFVVGDGTRVSFFGREFMWGEFTRESFPNLFSVTSVKTIS